MLFIRLGCCYCCFSPPFTAPNQSALFLKIKTGKYTPLSPKLYSQDLAFIINKMLQLSVHDKLTSDTCLS